MKKMFINGRFLTQTITGVQRFALKILHGLGEIISADSTLKIPVLAIKKSAIAIHFNNINGCLLFSILLL